MEQTENILWNEMGRTAAASVTKSLLYLSSVTPSNKKDAPEMTETAEDKEKVLLNTNVNWKKIAYIASGVIESIPNSLATTTLPNNSVNSVNH